MMERHLVLNREEKKNIERQESLDSLSSDVSEIWLEAKENFSEKTGLRGYGNNWDTNLAPKIKIFIIIRKMRKFINRRMDFIEKGLMQLASLVTFRDRRAYKKFRLDLDSKSTFGDLSLVTPKLQSFWDDYSSRLGLKKSYSTIRVAYYLMYIFKFLPKKNKKLDVVEIGAGAANLAYGIIRSVEKCNYIIVDLPEVAEQAYSIFQKYDDIVLFRSDELEDFNNSKATKKIIWLSPNMIDEIAPRFADLVVNTESFAEMRLSIAKAYTCKIPNILKIKGLYFSVNRIARDPDEGREMKNYSSPIFYNDLDLLTVARFFDEFRASIPNFFDTPNIIEVFEKEN